MPRSRRRRANDRSRAVEQRRIAEEALNNLKEDPPIMPRYIRVVYQPKAGEIVTAPTGARYQVQKDGSLKRLKEG